MGTSIDSKNMEESISMSADSHSQIPVKSKIGSLRTTDFGGIYKFTAQMLLIYTILIASVYGLANGDSANKDVWLVLLSTITGIVLPTPEISKHKYKVLDYMDG